VPGLGERIKLVVETAVEMALPEREQLAAVVVIVEEDDQERVEVEA
jgi:hypothetical protein